MSCLVGDAFTSKHPKWTPSEPQRRGGAGVVLLMGSCPSLSMGKSQAVCIYIYIFMASLDLDFLWEVLEMHVTVAKFPLQYQ